MIKNDQYQELVEDLKSLKSDLERQDLSGGSLETYLLNNTNMFLDSLKNAVTVKDIDNAASIFSRFCTESMDWDMPLYKQCSNIAESGFKLAKLY